MKGCPLPFRFMHLFALETDLEKIKRSLMGSREDEMMTVHRHWLPLWFTLAREILLFVALMALLFFFSAGPLIVVIVIIAWVLWAAGALLREYIELRYTFLFLTREKVVIVRQHLLRRRLLPITLNNIQSVEVQSQYWDLFGFGRIHIHLRDSGQVLTFSYVPDSARVAKKMTNIVSMYNQRIGLDHMLRPAPVVG
jgi:hypothetical protein